MMMHANDTMSDECFGWYEKTIHGLHSENDSRLAFTAYGTGGYGRLLSCTIIFDVLCLRDTDFLLCP